jgi:NAD(P)-dependent dehydrogenase (short-subunit alcohol dehydrogenase family)
MSEGLFDISGKVVVITGAGGVLFSNIAKVLAERGAKIAVMCGRKLAIL